MSVEEGNNENSGGIPAEGAPAIDTKASEGQTQDQTKNIKAEFDRKLSNVQDELRRVTEALQQQNARQQQQAPPVQEEDLETLSFKDPKKFAEVVAQRAASQASAMVSQQNQSQQEMNGMFASLTRDYPELNDPASDLYQKADQQLRSMRQSEKTTSAIKAVILEQAADLGLIKSSRRKPAATEGGDGFSLSSRGGTSTGTRAPAKQAVSEKTMVWADLLGIKTDDKKVTDRLEGYSKRNWNRYEDSRKGRK